MDQKEIIRVIKQQEIEFIDLQFTDILGIMKSTTITPEEIEKAFDCELMFDGSSVEGYGNIEESDMYLMPDENTFQIVPWSPREAIMQCDVYQQKGIPYSDCPRSILKKTVDKLTRKGYTANIGAEGEFFLFYTDEKNQPVFDAHDEAGYFDIFPVDKGSDVRKDMVRNLKKMGFRIEAAHHEVAPAQHEIDFQYGDALQTADRFMMFKYVAKNVAQQAGLYATFMPKPLTGENGSAMHCHQSLSKDGNLFYDANQDDGLSQIALRYMAGLLEHAPALTAIANPTVNSYKRLKAGYEAPVNIVWSNENRSALIRVPKARGQSTRIEFRSPDATSNPYLLFALMIESGMRGIEQRYDIRQPVDRNIFEMNQADQKEPISTLPQNLYEALEAFNADPFVKQVLGTDFSRKFLEYKYREWDEYGQHVHGWEINRYMSKY